MLQPEMAQMEIWMELKKWRKWCLKVPWQPCWTLLHGQKGKQERERERESGIFWLLLPTLGEISWGSGGPPPPRTHLPPKAGGRGACTKAEPLHERQAADPCGLCLVWPSRWAEPTQAAQNNPLHPEAAESAPPLGTTRREISDSRGIWFIQHHEGNSSRSVRE